MQSSTPLFASTNSAQAIDYFSNNVQFILTNDVNPSLTTGKLIQSLIPNTKNPPTGLGVEIKSPIGVLSFTNL